MNIMLQIYQDFEPSNKMKLVQSNISIYLTRGDNTTYLELQLGSQPTCDRPVALHDHTTSDPVTIAKICSDYETFWCTSAMYWGYNPGRSSEYGAYWNDHFLIV